MMSMQPAPKDTVVDDYHGTLVADPYRWLEDDASAQTQEWVAVQAARTRAYLDGLPTRARLHARLTAWWDVPRYEVPCAFGARLYYAKNDGLQNQAVLYLRRGESAPCVVLDPNQLSADGTVALTLTAFSHDGTLLAYGVSSSGSDWQEIRVRDVDGERDLPETLRWCKFARLAWAKDNSGFYYNRLPEQGSVPP
jgi:prolyl oligopeptidase